MGKIPENYLPPRDMWPEYLVPEEFADTPSELNLADFFLDRHVREGRGDNPAVKFMDKIITFAQLQQQVNKFGNALKEIGVEPQDRVGIRLVNSPQAIVAIFAIEKIGAIPVPTSPLWSGEEVAFVANDAEMTLFIVNAPIMPPVEAAKPNFEHGTKVIVIGGDPAEVKAAGNMVFEEMLEAGAPELEATMLKANDIGLMLYTSGTTGMPKGCVHFVRAVIIESKIVNQYVYKMQPGDVLGGAAPVSFAAGFGTFTLIPFEGGAAISLIPKFTPPDMLDLIQKHKITILTGLPTGYRALMKFPVFKNYDVSSVRLYTSGGDALGAETLQDWKKLTGKPIWEGLGSTEMLHLVTSNAMNPEPVPDSIGKPLPGVQVRIIDESGNDCKPNEVGSMILKGASGTLYWKPYIDDERLLKSQKKGVVNGWNKMGDAVFMKEDGNICFVSREDDMIKSSGYRIGPAEVEEAIEKHPAVAEARVVGIPDPDKGQITKAFVILKEGHEGSDEFFEELKTFLKEHIAVYKLPRAIEYQDSLPRTPTSKLLRRRLRPPRAKESARPEIRVPKRYFATRISGGPEASGKSPKLLVGKRYDCVFGVKEKADPKVGIAAKIPPEVLFKMLERQPQVLAVGEGLEIRDGFVPLRIHRDYTSVEAAVNFNAVKPGPCNLKLLLMLDGNAVRSIQYDFLAVRRLDTVSDAPVAEQGCELTLQEFHRLGEKKLTITVSSTVSGEDKELELHFIGGADGRVIIPLKKQNRKDLEEKKLQFLSHYAKSMQHTKTVKLSKKAAEGFLKDLKELGEEIFRTLFILPSQEHILNTGKNMRDILQSSHPAPIQIIPWQEHLPWMFLSDGVSALGLRHGVEYKLPGRWNVPLDLERRPLRMVCGLAPVFKKTELEDGRNVLEVQREAMAMLGGDRFEVRTTEDEQQWLAELGSPADLIYAYCHGSSDAAGPCLWMTRRANAIYGSTIDNPSESSKSIDWSRNPLVILAACTSGAIDPFRAVGLANSFMAMGARGCIAAEGEVPTTFASLFMKDFFKEFFVKGGEPVGDVLFNLRTRFLKDMHNPWGILFKQFCSSEIEVRND